MSYFNLKGKQVWGTSVFRVDVITKSSRLSSDFSGTITLYERRHEAETYEFSNLEEFIEYLKQFWQVALPNSRIQETRIARWLEEYMTEMGFRVNYDDVINAMRGKVEEVQSLEISAEVELEKEQITKLISESDDFMVTGITKAIKGDLTDIQGIQKVLTKFLNENKQKRETKAKSTVTFTAADGNERVMNETRNIVDPILDEEVSLWTGFSNNLSEPVVDITVEDIVPYSFKVLNTVTNGLESAEPEKTPEGLKYTWHCKTLESGEKIRIDYELQYRMLRTILIRDDNDITLLNTYNDISKDEKDIWIDAYYEFKEKTDILENVIIMDQIPNIYQFTSSQPEVVAPTGNIKHYSTGVEIEWRHTDVPVNTQFKVTYELKENPRIYRDKVIVQDDAENLIAEIVKVIKPLVNSDGYGIIFAILPNQEIEEITLLDRVSNDFEVISTHLDSGKFEEEDGQVMRRIKWKLKDCKKGEILKAYFAYKGEANHDLSQFNVIIPERSSMIVEQEVTQRADKIVMPHSYVTGVDI